MSLLSFKYLIQKEHSNQVRVYENILKMQVCRHRSLYHGEQALPGVRNSSCTCRCSTGHRGPAHGQQEVHVQSLHLQELAQVQDPPVEQEQWASLPTRGEPCGPKQEKKRRGRARLLQLGNFM